MAENTKGNSESRLDEILQKAVRAHASDVHIEPLMTGMHVRMRIDGYLQDGGSYDAAELEPIINRVKAISSLDISSHLPQDGHFEYAVQIDEEAVDVGESAKRSRLSDALSALYGDGREEDSSTQSAIMPPPKNDEAATRASAGVHFLNIRVSLFPTIYGNALVFRILNREDMLISLGKLGMDTETLAHVRDLISRSYGMFFVTGPSGSGKTTTLYSILQELKSKEKNIVTLEDPVEFYFGDIRQTNIHAEQGMTFAVGMKSILRQDPDIIMVGEVRDYETAEHAMRAALIGRMVGTTVHSNTTVGTIARLIDMGVERSLIAYAVNGIIAQRLVRKICESCKEPYVPDAQYVTRLGLGNVKFQFVCGKGCAACANTGFHGRTGIYAALQFDDMLRSLIIEKTSMAELQEYIERIGFKTLRYQAAAKVLAGETTVEEAGRAV